MKKVFFTTLILLAFCGNIFSQVGTVNAQKSSWFSVKNLTYGGRLGASFGKYASAVTIAPQVGYNFTNWLNAGLGIGYTYLSVKDNFSSEKNNYFGVNIYGRATIMQYILVQLQPELNRLWWSTEDWSAGEKISGTEVVPSFIVGAGFRLQNVYAMLYYDMVQNQRSPYGSTIGYSVGFSF